MDEIPENEAIIVNYVIFCHGATLRDKFGIPYYGRSSVEVAFAICDDTVLMGSDANIAAICNADDLPAQVNSSGDTINDMLLMGDNKMPFPLGIFKCIKVRHEISTVNIFPELNNPKFEGRLSDSIRFILHHHQVTHSHQYRLGRITVHACRVSETDATKAFWQLPKRYMEASSVDDLAERMAGVSIDTTEPDELADALSGMSLGKKGGNTRRRRRSSRGRRRRGRSSRGRRRRSKKTKK
jgi:hypothetical protein